MKLFFIMLTCLTFSNLSAEDKKPKDNKTLPKEVKENKSSKADKSKVIQLIKLLGADHFKARKKAKKDLIEMGFRAVLLLRDELPKTKDPEISESLKEIIRKLTFRLHEEELSDKEKRLTKLKFTTMSSENEAQAKVYTSEKNMILDINKVRIVIDKNLKGLNSSHEFTIETGANGSGGGNSTSNSLEIYKYSYRNGTGYWTICGESLTVNGGIIEIFGKKLNINADFKQILFINKDKSVKGILDIK
jgi:hypothetical protein